MSKGMFDDLPAENFGSLPPIPDGYAVVWCQGMEMFYWTKRGTDIYGGESWNRYWVRRAAIAYAREHES